jgi:hypothetical protein
MLVLEKINLLEGHVRVDHGPGWRRVIGGEGAGTQLGCVLEIQ